MSLAVGRGTRPRGVQIGGAVRRGLLRASVVAGLALAWQIGTVLAGDPVSWPTFGAIAGHFWERWLTNADAWTASVAPSVGRLVAGWAVAVATGIAAGTLIGLSRPARELTGPVLAFLRALPPPVLLPLFIVVLGIGDGMKVAAIAFGAVWPVLLNTSDGVGAAQAQYRDTSRVFRLGGLATLRRVILPAAAPRIFAGLRVSLSIAVILMVITEMVATVNGIGFELVQAQRGFRSLDVWSTILLLGIVGAGLNGLLAVAEWRVLRWQAGWRRTDR